MKMSIINKKAASLKVVQNSMKNIIIKIYYFISMDIVMILLVIELFEIHLL